MKDNLFLKKVLIIDDNEIDALVCARLIRKLKPDSLVNTFFDAKEALNHLKDTAFKFPDNLPDLIILDLYMPLMNGWFFLKEYRNIASRFDKQIVILIASSNGYDQDFKQMRNFQEINGYIGKPFTLEKMTNLINKYFAYIYQS
ncbi:MAG: response regulator [Microscillaceae bacterium]|nr:response regulator [Microscillaceae bacterium]